MKTVNMKKVALLISGGGAKGAFAVGVVKKLYQRFRKDGWFSIVGGTSTGALITPLAACMANSTGMAEEALRTLERVYSNVKTSDILQRQWVFEFLHRRDCFYESDPLRKLIKKEFKQAWFEYLQSEEAPHAYVVYTNFQTGRKVAVSPKDEDIDFEKFICAMMAACSVPVVMEATLIDGEVCYDGGVRDVLPFENAIKLGAETIVPIFLDPDTLTYSENKFNRIDKILLRTLAIYHDETRRNDVELANLVGIASRVKAELQQQFRSKRIRNKIEAVLGKDEFAPLFGDKNKLCSIIRGLSPPNDMTDNPLKFEPEKMRHWIELGEETADREIHDSFFVG